MGGDAGEIREAVRPDRQSIGTPQKFHGDDPFAFVLAKNLAQRRLDVSERAIIAGRLATLEWGKPSEKEEEGIPSRHGMRPVPHSSSRALRRVLAWAALFRASVNQSVAGGRGAFWARADT